MSIDPRQSPRTVLRTRAMLMIGGAVPISVRTLDIGVGGMSISVPNQLPPGQIVRVTFDMFFSGKNHTIAVNGRVTHCVYSGTDGFKAGLQLTDVDTVTSMVIESYIKR